MTWLQMFFAFCTIVVPSIFLVVMLVVIVRMWWRERL